MSGLQIKYLNDFTLVNFKEGVLYQQSIEDIGNQLFRLVEKLGRRKVVLNFSNVELILNEEFLSKLIDLCKKLINAQGRIVLCGINPKKPIAQVLIETKLDTYFTVIIDEEESFLAFSES